MSDNRARLIECFASVFPDLKTAEIPHASTATVPEWDSVASATLVSVVEEEFGVSLDLDELEGLTSFELVLGVLNEAGKSSNGM